MHCEQPNPKLYAFDGYVEVPGGGKEALDASNLLLRGSSLRKTDWVVRGAGRRARAVVPG